MSGTPIMERTSGTPCSSVVASGRSLGLVGACLPDVELEWTTAEHDPSISWIPRFLNLAVEAAKSTLIVYLYPGIGVRRGSGLPSAYAERASCLVGASLIGVSSESHAAQRSCARQLGVHHLLLSDEWMRLALALSLPTYSDSDGEHYLPLSMIVRDGRIEDVLRMDRAARRHVAVVAGRLRGPSRAS